MTETQTQAESTLIEQLFTRGAHLGYSRARRNASAKAFLYGSKSGIDIIDLEKTTEQLARAQAFLSELGANGKTVLWVGTKSEVRGFVEAAAKSLGHPYVAERWVGGMMTNWSEIKKRTGRLKELKDKFAKGELEKYTKKERLLFEREMATLEREFGGIATLEGLPAALVVVDSRREHIAIEEATKMKVPTIALLNTDCDARMVTYPVVANDSALASVSFIVEQFAEAYKRAPKAA